MGDDNPPPFTRKAILEALARSDADIAAGRVHELEDVLRELDAEDLAWFGTADAAAEAPLEKP